MGRTRINLANPQELLEIPGIDGAKVDTIADRSAGDAAFRRGGYQPGVLGHHP